MADYETLNQPRKCETSNQNDIKCIDVNVCGTQKMTEKQKDADMNARNVLQNQIRVR